MAGQAKSGNEILLEQLTKQVAQLTSEQKAKEAAIKALNSEMLSEERAVNLRVAKAKELAEKEIASLRVDIAPLKDLKSQCDKLRSDIEKLKKEKLDAVTNIKEAKSLAIKEADAALLKIANRFSLIELAIDQCKGKVAGL